MGGCRVARGKGCVVRWCGYGCVCVCVWRGGGLQAQLLQVGQAAPGGGRETGGQGIFCDGGLGSGEDAGAAARWGGVQLQGWGRGCRGAGGGGEGFWLRGGMQAGTAPGVGRQRVEGRAQPGCSGVPCMGMGIWPCRQGAACGVESACRNALRSTRAGGGVRGARTSPLAPGPRLARPAPPSPCLRPRPCTPCVLRPVRTEGTKWLWHHKQLHKTANAICMD